MNKIRSKNKLKETNKKMHYDLVKTKEAYIYWKLEMDKTFSAPKWRIILLKYQRPLSQEKNKDTNQCVIIGIVITSGCGSIT